jgi:membrane-associated protein
MSALLSLFDFVLHVDKHLDSLIQTYGTTTYAILAAVVFAETGLVVTPLLPGDSLLFAGGMFAGRGALNPHLLFVVLVAAAVAGDNTNYWIGRTFGQRLVGAKESRIFKRSYMEKTKSFFVAYGPVTVVLARFVPIVRTFAPFVAGLGQMSYPKYLTYSVGGAVAWVGICVYAGYFLGGIPMIRDNFEITVLLIIAVSVLPMVIEFVRHRRAAAH